MEEHFEKIFDMLELKERLLAEIIVWLKAKDLWEECQKSLSIKITKKEMKEPEDNYMTNDELKAAGFDKIMAEEME